MNNTSWAKRLVQSLFSLSFHETKCCASKPEIFACVKSLSVKIHVFTRKYPEKVPNFLARAFGARELSIVTFRGKRAEEQPLVSSCDWCNLWFRAVFMRLNASSREFFTTREKLFGKNSCFDKTIFWKSSKFSSLAPSALADRLQLLLVGSVPRDNRSWARAIAAISDFGKFSWD